MGGVDVPSLAAILDQGLAVKKADTPRIVHLITGLGTGGAEMMLYKLLSKLDGQK